MANNRSVPQTVHAIRRSIRRFAMCGLGTLGHVPAYLSPRARRKALANLGHREPLDVDIPYRTTVRMAAAVSNVIVDVVTFRRRSDRRRLTYLTAACAVSVSHYFSLSGTLVEGTAEAILSAVRYVNEDMLGLLPPPEERVIAFTREALAGLAHEDPFRGAHLLAAALRGMYGLRTMKERVATQKWLLVGIGVALAVSGCVLANR